MSSKEDRSLACPHCGWDASDDGQHDFCFRYLEEVTNIRRVERLRSDGTLQIGGEDHIAIEDDGSYHRLQCGNSLHEFPLPEGMKIDFV